MTGTYSVVVSKLGCPGDSIHKTIRVMQSPSVNLGVDTTICEGKTILLDAGNPGSSYEWNTGTISRTLLVTEPGIYSIKATNGMCSDKDEIIVDECSSEVWFPTAFSPNNDGSNDLFKPVSLRTINYYKIRVFNRWGQLIFESDDVKKGWNGTANGKPCPSGNYPFIAEYSTGINPSVVKRTVKQGMLTIIR